MYYIRFLKTPRLELPAKPGGFPMLKCLITITTDLGDALYPHAAALQVQVLPVDQAANVYNVMTVQWKPSMRVLPVEFSMPSSQHLVRQKKTAISAFCVRVKAVDAVLEAFQAIESDNRSFAPPTAAVMRLPVIMAVESAAVDPAKDILHAQRIVKRRLNLNWQAKGPQDHTDGVVPPSSLLIWEESGEESLARRVWPAAVTLTELLDRTINGRTLGLTSLNDVLKPQDSGRHLKVIELGAGCGVVGLALTVLKEHCDVLLTDLEDAKEIVEINLSELDESSIGRVKFKVLDWFEELPAEVKSNKYDIIIVADCTYNPDSIPALVKTIDALTSGVRKTKVVVAGKRRHPSEAVFGELMTEAKLVPVESLQLLDGRPDIDGDIEDIPIVYVDVFSRKE